MCSQFHRLSQFAGISMVSFSIFWNCLESAVKFLIRNTSSLEILWTEAIIVWKRLNSCSVWNWDTRIKLSFYEETMKVGRLLACTVFTTKFKRNTETQTPGNTSPTFLVLKIPFFPLIPPHNNPRLSANRSTNRKFHPMRSRGPVSWHKDYRPNAINRT
jgi:hypothetical protein